MDWVGETVARGGLVSWEKAAARRCQGEVRRMRLRSLTVWQEIIGMRLTEVFSYLDTRSVVDG